MFHVKPTVFAISLGLTVAILSTTVFAAGEAVELPGKGVVLTGLLYSPSQLPAGSVASKKLPAIVLLHGCSGLLDKAGKPVASYVFWAEHFQRLGYVTLLLDSFTPRGTKEICTQKSRTINPDKERSDDAHAALAWLAGRPNIDASRIHLLGWSNGAMTVLHAIGPKAAKAEAAYKFRSAVAFYPGCAAVLKEAGYRNQVPLLIQSGGADDWTPAKPCEELSARLVKSGAEAAIDVYPGAHHSFDRLNLTVRYRPEVRNPASPTGWGATVGTDPKAREKAIQRATVFIEARNAADPESRPN